MTGLRRLAVSLALLATGQIVLCPTLPAADRGGSGAPTGCSHTSSMAAWDNAFQDRSGKTPIHFTAHYLDGRGQTHRLEEWRIGQTHLRRKTDDRIDLYATARGHILPGRPADYSWTIFDLQTRIAHRVTTAGMMHLGMLYSYYSMAHLLASPTGSFTVEHASDPGTRSIGLSSVLSAVKPLTCTWWQINAAGQPATRVCWVPRYGLPVQTWSQAPDGWHLAFQIDKLETSSISFAIFSENTAGFQVRNLDEIESED